LYRIYYYDTFYVTECALVYSRPAMVAVVCLLSRRPSCGHISKTKQDGHTVMEHC